MLAGLLAGALSALLTRAVYASEDAFQQLPIHWMWWPAIGGLVIGVGGWIFPQALGVGYDVIGDLLKGDVGGASSSASSSSSRSSGRCRWDRAPPAACSRRC